MLNFYDVNFSSAELKQANKGLAGVLRRGLDRFQSREGESFAQKLFPPLVYMQQKEKCERATAELLLMIEDEYVHCLSTLYKYALYRWLEACVDQEMLLRHETDDAMEANDEALVELNEQNLGNPLFYLERCFLDHRFLHVPAAFGYYKEDHEQYLSMKMNLDEYVDLMPEDIRVEYQAMKRERG